MFRPYIQTLYMKSPAAFLHKIFRIGISQRIRWWASIIAYVYGNGLCVLCLHPAITKCCNGFHFSVLRSFQLLEFYFDCSFGYWKFLRAHFGKLFQKKWWLSIFNLKLRGILFLRFDVRFVCNGFRTFSISICRHLYGVCECSDIYAVNSMRCVWSDRFDATCHRIFIFLFRYFILSDWNKINILQIQNQWSGFYIWLLQNTGSWQPQASIEIFNQSKNKTESIHEFQKFSWTIRV